MGKWIELLRAEFVDPPPAGTDKTNTTPADGPVREVLGVLSATTPGVSVKSVPPERARVDTSEVAWTAENIERFVARRDRLLRWGWSEDQAEALAERLVMRDREQDDRVSCSECRQGRATRCADVAPLPADVLHHCPRFQP